MQRVHSIKLSETDDNKHAILIELGGELDEGFEPVIRMVLDKTLRRDRQGGVVINLSAAVTICNPVVGRMINFTKMLRNDGIRSILVLGDRDDPPASALMLLDSFDAVVPSIDVAEDILDVSFQ